MTWSAQTTVKSVDNEAGPTTWTIRARVTEGERQGPGDGPPMLFSNTEGVVKAIELVITCENEIAPVAVGDVLYASGSFTAKTLPLTPVNPPGTGDTQLDPPPASSSTNPAPVGPDATSPGAVPVLTSDGAVTSSDAIPADPNSPAPTETSGVVTPSVDPNSVDAGAGTADGADVSSAVPPASADPASEAPAVSTDPWANPTTGSDAGSVTVITPDPTVVGTETGTPSSTDSAPTPDVAPDVAPSEAVTPTATGDASSTPVTGP